METKYVVSYYRLSITQVEVTEREDGKSYTVHEHRDIYGDAQFYDKVLFKKNNNLFNKRKKAIGALVNHVKYVKADSNETIDKMNEHIILLEAMR